MNLFKDNTLEYAPLAHRMRPDSLENFLGQKHVLNKNSAVFNSIKNKSMGNCILYGPPGVGKTTLANIIAKTSGANLEIVNAVSSGVNDVKKIIQKATQQLEFYGKKTYLLLDECHRWSKAQSDSILKAIEKGIIILTGSTTENPFISMTNAITSRCIVINLKRLTDSEIKKGLQKAISNKSVGLGNYNVNVSSDIYNLIVRKSGGDIRKAYNILEMSVKSLGFSPKSAIDLDEDTVLDVSKGFSESVSTPHYYDLLSAFCKSIRAGDENAAIFYAHKMIDSGVDPLIVARRLVVHSSEDIGMADSNALLISNAALNAIKNIGHEAVINLTHAIIYVAKTYKSDSVIKAISLVKNDIEKISNTDVPAYLKSTKEGKKLYKNPHNSSTVQDHMPKNLKGRIYYKSNKVGKEN